MSFQMIYAGKAPLTDSAAKMLVGRWFHDDDWMVGEKLRESGVLGGGDLGCSAIMIIQGIEWVMVIGELGVATVKWILRRQVNYSRSKGK